MEENNQENQNYIVEVMDVSNSDNDDINFELIRDQQVPNTLQTQILAKNVILGMDGIDLFAYKLQWLNETDFQPYPETKQNRKIYWIKKAGPMFNNCVAKDIKNSRDICRNYKNSSRSVFAEFCETDRREVYANLCLCTTKDTCLTHLVGFVYKKVQSGILIKGLVMEAVKDDEGNIGLTLNDVLEKETNGRDGWRSLNYININDEFTKKCWVSHGIAAALRFIRAKEFIHRDISPNNIILGHNGIRICDFELATGPLTIQKNDMTIDVGTPLYRAPEISKGTYSFPVDVYSFGKILEQIWKTDMRYHSLENTINMCLSSNPLERPLPEVLEKLFYNLLYLPAIPIS